VYQQSQYFGANYKRNACGSAQFQRMDVRKKQKSKKSQAHHSARVNYHYVWLMGKAMNFLVNQLYL
jgi:hypothetical protein